MRNTLIAMTFCVVCSTPLISQWYLGIGPGAVVGELHGALNYIPWFDSSRTVRFNNTESSPPSLQLRIYTRYAFSERWSASLECGYDYISAMTASLATRVDYFLFKTGTMDSVIIERTQPRAPIRVKTPYCILAAHLKILKQVRFSAGLSFGGTTTTIDGAGDYDIDTTPAIIRRRFNRDELFYRKQPYSTESYSSFTLGAVVRCAGLFQLNDKVTVVPSIEYDYPFTSAHPSETLRLHRLSFIALFEFAL